MPCSCSVVFDVKHWLEKRGKVLPADKISMAAAAPTQLENWDGFFELTFTIDRFSTKLLI
jgi:hypothetical protein